ncbi:perlucin-like protein [Pomacea canaliculata]|uniref:perlucin-like protein n=1 Tax=Pomacea canaliculata TaxID=400727 RepID=UPI000D7351F5|nr:perlucin-like protein [Pomacea canaliculata]
MSPTPLLLLLLLCGTCYCSCPDSWTPFGSSCYVFIVQPLTWIDAAALCGVFGGNLVEINNLSENDFVWNLLTSRNVSEAWIGMSDLAQEGHWRWSSGATLSLTNWWPGEPNNLNGNENGGEIWTGGKWNDTPTSRELPSVCERNK